MATALGGVPLALKPSFAVSADHAARPDILDKQTWDQNASVASAVLESGTCNVRSFGAVGDGIADDTSAIQSALDVAKASKVAVYFPYGNYKITRTLKFTQVSGWKIYGVFAGAHNSTDGARITWAGVTGGTMLLLQGVYRGYLGDLVLDGQGTAGTGLDYDAVASGLITSLNTVERITVARCTGTLVRVSKSAFETDQTDWYSCAFIGGSNRTSTGHGVSIEDANAVWHQFWGCAFYSCNVGISAVRAGTGGHFDLHGCRFVANTVVDVRPYIGGRATLLSGCHSELSRRFLEMAQNSVAEAPCTLMSCTVNEVLDADGVGVLWNAENPLVIVGGKYANRAGLPFKFESNRPDRGTLLATGVAFPHGNPWSGVSNNGANGCYIHTVGCTYTSHDDGTARGRLTKETDGDIPSLTPSTALALSTTATQATQVNWVGTVWCKVASGTSLAAGVNNFWVKSRHVTGGCAIEIPAVTSWGGQGAAIIGLSGVDDHDASSNAAKIVVRSTAAVKLRKDLIFSVKFRNKVMTY